MTAITNALVPSLALRRARSPIAGLLTCACGGNIGVATNTSKGHTYARLACAWHRGRGPAVCENSTSMRMETVAEPLLAFVRAELLDPKRVALAVGMVNAKIDELASGAMAAEKVSALASEVTRLEREMARLADALARGTAYEALSAALAEKDRRLKAARSELAALSCPAPPPSIPKLTADDVTTRLGRLWDDIQKLDGDRARLALQQIFDAIVVKPLKGAWKNGWLLEMKTRPWAVMLPKGAVAQLVGCGGGI